MAEFKKLINPPIKASEIDSESATSGQVLTANGTGGASWQNASEVEVVQATGTSTTSVMSQKAVTDAIATAITTALNTAV